MFIIYLIIYITLGIIEDIGITTGVIGKNMSDIYKEHGLNLDVDKYKMK